MRTLLSFLASATVLLGGCDASSLPNDDSPAYAEIGGKADALGGVEEGSIEALAILRLANEAALEVLDDDVGLDARAARGIVEQRVPAGADDAPGYHSLAELDAVPFVGSAALAAMLAYVTDNDLLGRRLRIATFNVRWFGLDGSLYGSFGSETRSASIRAFVEQTLSAHDVVVFQEVVDVELFEREVMFDHQCVTYESAGGKHQHVVVCHASELALVPPRGDDNFAIEDVALSRLRPALHGEIVDQDGAPLAYLAGVHLKAGAHETQVRLDQAAILAAHVEEVRAPSRALPVIVVGDFNTHVAEKTGLPDDDDILISELLADHLGVVELPVESTFRSARDEALVLDRAWVSDDVSVVNVRVPGPCNPSDFAAERDAIAQFRDTVSDHCPVSFDLVVP